MSESRMDRQDWPLRRFNYFAIPIAIGMAAFNDSFWGPLLITAAIGAAIANVIATLWIANTRKQIASANPLARLSAEIQGATDTSLQIRFIFVQSLSGALIIAMWFSIAWGVAFLIR